MTVSDTDFDRAQSNGTVLDESPDVMRQQLAELVGLQDIDRTIVDAHMFGRGPSASVDLHLSGDMKLTFERFHEVTKPASLTAHLASIGIARTFKGTQAALVGALISRVARHHESECADDAAREWGSEFLRLAAVQEVELDDQAERWRAFSSLERLNPARDAGEDRSSFTLAQMAVVLLDKATGMRLVRAGWLLGYVKREAGVMSPQALGVQMERVGWQRPGGEGRIKATNPTDGRTLNWRFYTVPKGWGER